MRLHSLEAVNNRIIMMNKNEKKTNPSFRSVNIHQNFDSYLVHSYTLPIYITIYFTFLFFPREEVIEIYIYKHLSTDGFLNRASVPSYGTAIPYIARVLPLFFGDFVASMLYGHR